MVTKSIEVTYGRWWRGGRGVPPNARRSFISGCANGHVPWRQCASLRHRVDMAFTFMRPPAHDSLLLRSGEICRGAYMYANVHADVHEGHSG